MSENPDVWEGVAEAAPELPADFEPAPEGSAPTALDVAPEPGSVTMRAVLAADAKTRAGRSALQSTAVTALAAVCGVAATYLHDGDVSHLDWKAFAMAALVAGGTPIAAYLHRMLGK